MLCRLKWIKSSLGDYLYINRSNADLGHGFLVIGWGEITSCPDALGRIWTYDPPLDQQHGQLFTDFADAGTDLVVPYVVDFSGGISFSQLQRVRPRPFYCTFHQNPGSFALEDSYAFYDFPNETTIEVQQLYTPITWTWGP